MIKFLHAADLHLDSRFSGLSPQQASQCRKEQRQLLFTLCEAANANGCDLLLLSGDLFDSDNAYPETIEAMIAAFSSCQAEIFIAPGNHDFCSSGSAYETAKWPENVHIFKTETVSFFDLPSLSCRVYGAGFCQSYAHDLLQNFHADAAGMQTVMVLHGDAGNPGSDYNAITKEQIAASGLSYLALGHIHAASGLQKSGAVYYAWPGCTAGRGFDELGEKGAYLGTIEHGEVHLTFLPLALHRYEILELRAGDNPLCEIENILPKETKQDIYRIILTGEAEPVSIPALYEALNPRFYALQLRDQTRPKRNLWEGWEDDTLRGLFLRTLKERYEAAEDETERQTIAAAARLGRDAMEGRELE